MKIYVGHLFYITEIICLFYILPDNTNNEGDFYVWLRSIDVGNLIIKNGNTKGIQIYKIQKIIFVVARTS